jgi:hypothetical protein
LLIASRLGPGASAMIRKFELPPPRGPLSERLFKALLEPPASGVLDLDGCTVEPGAAGAELLHDHDLQLALYVCYELNYAQIAGVDDRWEHAPALLEFRAALEEPFEAALAALVSDPAPGDLDSVGATLMRIVAEDDAPPLSRHLEVSAPLEQVLEFLMHRSAYQLKEADPHSWVIPRLTGAPKAALVEVQSDEYGGGRPERIHAELFAHAMSAVGLDPTYGAYITQLPGITLATVNLMSLFGLHRRLAPACVGHLAVFEMTSSLPNRRYGNALRRLGFGAEATDFFDEHVEADAVHENIATWDLADRLGREEPDQAATILFGARALLALDRLWIQWMLRRWETGGSSLLAADDLAAVPTLG